MINRLYKTFAILTVVTIVTTSVVALAQQAEQADAWSGESELGYIMKSGNTTSESLYARQSIIYDAKPWVNTIKIEASNTSSEVTQTDGSSSNERTGERYYLTEQLDWFINTRSYLLGRLTGEKDRFSGFENQSTWVVGYGYAFFDQEQIKLKTELGAGQSYDKPKRIEDDPATVEDETVDSDTVDATLVYFRQEFKYQFSQGVGMGQELSIEDSDENTISRFSIFLKANLVKTLALKVGYSLKHVDEVPVETRHKDEEFTTTLTYSF